MDEPCEADEELCGCSVQIGSVNASLFITGVLVFLGVRADAVAQKASEHVTVSAKGTSFALENGVIGARWSFADGIGQG
jgi:hypothetical protein